jgi:hypothetical protein
MKHSWEEKLDQQGLKFVEVSAKLRRIRQPSTLGQSELTRWVQEQKDVLSAYPELDAKRKVNLNPEFLRFLLRTNPDIELTEEEWLGMFEHEEFPMLRADELELHQRVFLYLESDQNKRFEIYGAVASVIILLRTFFSGGLKRQLGTKKPSLFKMFTALAQNLEWFGAALRGDLKVPPGRVNVELASLVDAILKHQKEPLTQMELYNALETAGAELPEDPEAFRLWLHRARKQGLVKNFRSSRTDADSLEDGSKA